jgi:predicted nucleic acid-binding protein
MRLAIDGGVLVRLAEAERPPSADHTLVGRGSLRSDAMGIHYRDVRAGRRSEAEAKAVLERVTAVKVRLLADRVSRATAWAIAREQGRDEIGDAEHLAVARLQADALVTDDPRLAAAAAGIVPLAAFDDLLG